MGGTTGEVLGEWGGAGAIELVGEWEKEPFRRMGYASGRDAAGLDGGWWAARG